MKNARHLSASMDTLVSMGITAACSWSVYAMFFLDRDKSGTSGLDQVLHGSGGGIYLEVVPSVTTFQLRRAAAADGTVVRGSARERIAADGRACLAVRGRPVHDDR